MRECTRMDRRVSRGNRMWGGALWISAIALLAGCAHKDGDHVHCPECDNLTELLVGERCVPIAQVEPCGPDGHPHGTYCHCFLGQDPVMIGGAEYCLQEDCGDPEHDQDPDHDDDDDHDDDHEDHEHHE